MRGHGYLNLGIALGLVILGSGTSPAVAADSHTQVRDSIGVKRGICAVLGDPKCELAIELAKTTDLLVYVQLPDAEQVESARRAVDEAGFYGSRIYVEQGDPARLHLADSIADALVALGEAATATPEAEVRRVLCPRAKAILGSKELTKPLPEGIDDWSHPYHGPDNNPQSRDQLARAPYLTQFLAEPRYGPSPQVAVVSAGRAFKAFGNVAWKEREEPWLNTLVAFNGFNGTMLWKRELATGYMVHRNTIIATPAALYLGDDKSCKVLDPATGKVADEIVPDSAVAGGTFWKWMGLENGVLYALIGEREQDDPVVRWRRTAHGWPWDEVSKGYNQPTQPWGFGRHLLAIDPKTKQVLWHHDEDEPADARAVCMKGNRIFLFRFGAYLTCLGAKDGHEIWRKTKDNAPELFEALGRYLKRQGWQTDWRTVCYLKCSDDALYFAGPQVGCLLAVSARDGRILWRNKYDNFHLVLRDDGLYAISGPWGTNVSKKFQPLTGEVLAELPTGRRACTRTTGAVDAVLDRAMGGTVRWNVAEGRREWISPMRPSCHDGVTIGNGLLYWWPWTCDCQLQIYGVTCLGPAGGFNFTPPVVESERLQVSPTPATAPATLGDSAADWPTFRANNRRTATSPATIAASCVRLWEFKPNTPSPLKPTAPVAAGELVLVSGSDGVVRALDAATGKPRWTAYTGGEIRFPPTIWQGRALVGSGDGWVYALDAGTGMRLWRFRAAPAERKMPVYGTLLSTWPAASGVLVEDGVAYAAAGIVNYDGTYVYALDAATGKLKWHNDTSGHLYAQARTGVSVQGHLLMNDKRLYLAGGNAVSPAVYDIADGKCLNDPKQLADCESICPRGQELALVGAHVVGYGKPLYTRTEYPVADVTVTEKILHASKGQRDLVWLNNEKLLCFAPIDRERLNKCVTQDTGHGHVIKPWGKFDIPDQPLWTHESKSGLALAVCENAAVLATAAELVAIDLQTGKPLWTQSLPAAPVPWGLAIDRAGRALLTLEDGRVLCFGHRG